MSRAGAHMGGDREGLVADLGAARTFLGQWLRNPVRTASFTPSGRQLARLMVDSLPPGCKRVAELGAGTGVFTRAMLARGVRPADLLVVEINPRLASLLRGKFPGVAVACADACQLDRLVAGERGTTVSGGLDAVLSGLGMLSMGSGTRVAILRAAFRALAGHGCFIQFTYGPASPVRRREREALGLAVTRRGLALRNLPPATVYVYTRQQPSVAASEAPAA